MQKYNVILATDKNGGIGLNKKLPWKFNIDDKYFYNKIRHKKSRKSIKNTLIIGYKSFLGFSEEELDLYIFYVIARDSYQLNIQNNNPNIYFFENFEEAYKNCSAAPSRACPGYGAARVWSLQKTPLVEEQESDIWILGGKDIYEKALSHPACNKIYLTLIDGVFDCDVYVDLSKYNIVWNKELINRDVNLKDNLTYDLYFKEGELYIFH